MKCIHTHLIHLLIHADCLLGVSAFLKAVLFTILDVKLIKYLSGQLLPSSD